MPFALAVTVLTVGTAHAAMTRRRAQAELVGAFRLALEFLLAATLIRLAAGGELRVIAFAAALVLLRQLLGLAGRLVLRIPADSDR